MKSLLTILSILPLFVVSNCAPMAEAYSIPEGYTGPTATIKDSYRQVNGAKGEVFTVTEINGKPDRINPYSYVPGGGLAVHLADAQRRIEAGRTLLSISGYSAYGADGAALADSLIGGNNRVSGDVFINAKPNRVYQVKGTLSKKYSAVWIEDLRSGKIVGTKIEKRK